MGMTGKQYRNLVAAYLAKNFAARGLEIYTELRVGKSIIAKERQVDVMLFHNGRAFALECKTQSVSGTADEKLIYSLEDLRAMRIPGAIVYAGEGFSDGIVQMLRAHPMAAYCNPEPTSLARDRRETIELDVLLAQEFGWWDLIQSPGRKFHLDSWSFGAISGEGDVAE